MTHRLHWRRNAERIARMAVLIGALVMAIGCDSDAPPAVEQVPDFKGELVLADEAPVSGGAMKVTLEIAPPDDVLSPDDPIDGPLTPKAAADIHFEAQIRYTGAVLGGRNTGDFVPYLNVSLKLTNRDSGKSLTTTLVPHVGIAKGYHYARNIALVKTLGASEAGYDAVVTIRPPSQFGSADASSISPGIAMHSDISESPNLSGTVLGPDPIVVSGGFILGDFKTITSKEVGEEAAPTETEPAGGGYAY